MPRISTLIGTQVDMSDADYTWITERSITSPSGAVTFSAAATKRYRKLTGQECEPAWQIRHQMQNVFAEYL